MSQFSALIHEPSFKQTAGEAVFSKARVINSLGNRAVHGARAVPPDDALVAFHVSYWLARTYARAERPAPDLAFDANKVTNTVAWPEAQDARHSGRPDRRMVAGRDRPDARDRQAASPRSREADREAAAQADLCARREDLSSRIRRECGRSPPVPQRVLRESLCM